VLVDAERQVLEAASERGLPACVVRPSGLYGPGRYGLLERVRRGSLALGDGDDRWTNWCHRADITRMTLAALDHGETGAIYHASDATPAPRREVVEWISAALGIDAPRRDAAATGETASRPVANRRISAASSRERLGTPLLYPSFREGLAEGIASITEG
jgi:nucleoside-diphosphate-sugar epimerase